jgi:hypothetical protein
LRTGDRLPFCIEENLTLVNGTTPYLVQRLWSEKTWAEKRENPCVPADGKWFGAAIVGNDPATSYNINLHVDSRACSVAAIRLRLSASPSSERGAAGGGATGLAASPCKRPEANVHGS